MKGSKRNLIILLSAVVLLAFPGAARADIAPPINPPGSSVQPGSETTQVRMAAEKVVVNVLDDGLAEGLGKAHVTAEFTMHNLGAQAETMQARFPLSANNGWGAYPQITGVTVKVDGKAVLTSVASYEQPGYGSDLVPWAEFSVTFPPGEDVLISVAYDLLGSGYYPYTAFYYLLETGAAWKDTIGRAEIILRLPYAASPLNVVQDFQIGWAETNRGAVFEGNEARWVYEDFEPGPFAVVQNMEFALVAPGAWKKVLIAQSEVKTSPNDGEAWGRLAKAYKDLFLQNKGYRDDVGGEELYRLSVAAYEECLRLKPNDAQWHAGFADLLANRAYWDTWMSGPTQDTLRALEEIHTALNLAPNDAKVQEMAQNLTWLIPDGIAISDAGYDFPWLTQTPTPRPPTPTIAPAFDPQKLSGVYTSAPFDIWDGQQVALELVVNPDYSAVLKTTFQGQNQEQVEQGVWTDIGDGLLRVVMAWANGEPYTMVFRVEDALLQAVEYPSYFGEAGISLQKPAPPPALPTETTPPTATQPLEPTALPAPSQTATTLPVQAVIPIPQRTPAQSQPGAGGSPGLPCASVGLTPLAILGWLWRRRFNHE